MEYYGLRKAGDDIDFIIAEQDYQALSEKYPESKKDLFGDLGIIKDGFELWKTICLFDYNFLSDKAIETDKYLIISLEKLLFLKCLGLKIPKYHKDVELIIQKIMDNQYGST